MDIAALIEELSRPRAYGVVDDVDVRQTHVSVVFLTGAYAYKIRKSVNLGFLDFSTLAARKHDCDEEVRLNARLAPDVYLGVVPVVLSPVGLLVDGSDTAGPIVEWAVKMRRLHDAASLLARLERGEAIDRWLMLLADRLSAFHETAERSARSSEFGRCKVFAKNAIENFEQTAGSVGTLVSRRVYERLRTLTGEHLARLGPLIDARSERGVPCDGHGDLRLEHVYIEERQGHVGPEKSSSSEANLLIIDCLEYAERFRLGDPVLDVAFLTMDLLFRGEAESARAFTARYLRRSGDEREGLALLPLYVAYRSMVRAKVRGMELAQRELSDARRGASLVKARAHFLLALGALERPSRRPALVLVSGLPGSGKSTLARELARRASFEVVRSDVVRKELVGLDATTPTPAAWKERIYAEEWTARTYAACLARAEELLSEGGRVIVDATFAAESRRTAFLDAARAMAIPAVWFVCDLPRDIAQGRLLARRNDASDADLGVRDAIERAWEEAGPRTCRARVTIDTRLTLDAIVGQAEAALRERELCDLSPLDD